MKLLSVSSFREAISASDNPDVNTTLAGVLEQVTSCLESYLRTRFNRSVLTDTFYLNPAGEAVGQPYITLLLRQGLVDQQQSLTIVSGVTHQDAVSNPTPYTGGVLVNYEKGFVSLMDPPAGHYYFKVSYTAGLLVSNDEDTVYGGVPSALSSATVVYGLDVYRAMKEWPTASIISGSKGTGDVTVSMPAISSAAALSLAPYIRFKPSALRAIEA